MSYILMIITTIMIPVHDVGTHNTNLNRISTRISYSKSQIVHTQDFNNKENCEKALSIVKQNSNTIGVCTPK